MLHSRVKTKMTILFQYLSKRCKCTLIMELIWFFLHLLIAKLNLPRRENKRFFFNRDFPLWNLIALIGYSKSYPSGLTQATHKCVSLFLADFLALFGSIERSSFTPWVTLPNFWIRSRTFWVSTYLWTKKRKRLTLDFYPNYSFKKRVKTWKIKWWNPVLDIEGRT